MKTINAVRDLPSLPLYRAETKCPKCGGEHAAVAHCAERALVKPQFDDQECREHMRRTCIQCQFGWNEAPLDCRRHDKAEAAQPQDAAAR